MHARLIQSTRQVARLATAGARIAAPKPAALPRAMYVPISTRPASPSRPVQCLLGLVECTGWSGTFGTSSEPHGASVVVDAPAKLMGDDRFDPPLLLARGQLEGGFTGPYGSEKHIGGTEIKRIALVEPLN